MPYLLLALILFASASVDAEAPAPLKSGKDTVYVMVVEKPKKTRAHLEHGPDVLQQLGLDDRHSTHAERRHHRDDRDPRRRTVRLDFEDRERPQPGLSAERPAATAQRWDLAGGFVSTMVQRRQQFVLESRRPSRILDRPWRLRAEVPILEQERLGIRREGCGQAQGSNGPRRTRSRSWRPKTAGTAWPASGTRLWSRWPPDALLRGSEIAALEVGDVTRRDDGTGRLLVRASKTDPEGTGAVLYLRRSTMRR